MAEDRSSRRDILRKILTLGPVAALAGAFGTNGAKPAQAADGNFDNLSVAYNMQIGTAVNPSIYTPNTLTLFIDSDNNQSGEEFRIAKDASTFGYGTTLMVIQESGNVGIGTASPQALLHVNKPTGGATIKVESGDTWTQLELTPSQGAGAWISFGKPAPAVGDLYFWAERSAQTVMFIRGATGEVGIGVVNPGAKLDVAGDIRLTGSIQMVGTGVLEGPARKSYYDT